MFIWANDYSTLINTDHIVCVVDDADTDLAHCKMIDGKSVAILGRATTDISAIGPVVPAEQGFRLLGFGLDEAGKEFLDWSPIIAWKIDLNGEGLHQPLAVFEPTADEDGRVQRAIQFPDGRLCDLARLNLYRNRDEWTSAMREKLTAKRTKTPEVVN